MTNAGLPPGALCVRSGATLSAIATGLSPGAPEIQWPYLKDPSLPKQGWRHSGGLFWHFPSVVAVEVEDSDIANEFLMYGTAEVCWRQNPTFRVWKPLQRLRVYDQEGPVTISDETAFNWEKMVNMFLKLRPMLACSLSRRKSATETRLPRFDFTMLPSSLVNTSVDCLSELLPQPTTPVNLAVDIQNWRDMANVFFWLPGQWTM